MPADAVVLLTHSGHTIIAIGKGDEEHEHVMERAARMAHSAEQIPTEFDQEASLSDCGIAKWWIGEPAWEKIEEFRQRS